VGLVFNLFIFWLFYYSTVLIAIILIYPCFNNFCELYLLKLNNSYSIRKAM